MSASMNKIAYSGRRFRAFLFLLLFVPLSPLHAQDSKENADFKLAVNLFNDRM